MSIVTTPAILLRAYPYSETSRIFRFLTAELGVVGVMARGARRGHGKGKGALDVFDEGELTLYVRESRELQTFKDFNTTRARRGLASDIVRFAGACVLAELVLRHSGEEEARRLYAALRDGLDRLEAEPGEDPLPRVLAEGWRIVSALGYRPQLERCSGCGRSLAEATGLAPPDDVFRFDFASGGLRCPDCGREGEGRRVGPVARRHLMALVAGTPPPELPGARAHLRLLTDFVTWHLAEGRPLPSLRFLGDVAGA